MDLKKLEVEAIAEEQNDYDDRTANQSAAVRSSDLSDREKRIVAKFVGMFELALLSRNFDRAALHVTLCRAEMSCPDILGEGVDEITGLRSSQCGVLRSHGIHSLRQLAEYSKRDLSQLKNVGRVTVATLAEYMRSIGHPLRK